jgi:hypothetical protein
VLPALICKRPRYRGGRHPVQFCPSKARCCWGANLRSRETTAGCHRGNRGIAREFPASRAGTAVKAMLVPSMKLAAQPSHRPRSPNPAQVVLPVASSCRPPRRRSANPAGMSEAPQCQPTTRYLNASNLSPWTPVAILLLRRPPFALPPLDTPPPMTMKSSLALVCGRRRVTPSALDSRANPRPPSADRQYGQRR